MTLLKSGKRAIVGAGILTASVLDGEYIPDTSIDPRAYDRMVINVGIEKFFKD